MNDNKSKNNPIQFTDLKRREVQSVKWCECEILQIAGENAFLHILNN